MSLVHRAHRADFYPLLYRLSDRFEWDKNLVACVMCELVCSFFLIYGGLSINATETIQSQTTHIPKFEYGISISWGLWILLTNYIGSQLSGPHCNPAISFLFYVLGAIPLKRFLLYVLVQVIGCYLGSLFVFIIYFDGISHFDGGTRQVFGPNATAGIFATYPKDYLSVTGGFIDQFFTTAILALIVLAITDDRNKVPKMAQPAIIGIALWAIISQWSHNIGCALNPARDFGPRLMTLTVGYGWEVFSYKNYKYFWIPIVAPMLGAVGGGYVYKACLGDYLPSSIDVVVPTGPFHHPSIHQPSIMITRDSFAASRSISPTVAVVHPPKFMLPSAMKRQLSNRVLPTEVYVSDVKPKCSSVHIEVDS